MSQSAEVGIVAAMLMEIKPLISGWKREVVTADGRKFIFYRHGKAVATCCGPTTVNAVASTKVLVESYAPRMLISVGFAGSLSAAVRVPDIVIPERVVDELSAQKFETTAGSGVLVTSAKVVGKAEKEELASRWSAVAVDMEAAAVAKIAGASGCEFAAVKAVSDDVTTDMDFVGRFVEPSGFRTAAFLAYIAPRPGLWPAVRRLRINSERASSNLSSTLANILSSPEGIAGELGARSQRHAVSRA